MISPTQFDTIRSMAIYDSSHQISMWDDSFKAESSQNTDSSTVVEAEVKIDNRFEVALQEMLGSSKKYEQEANKLSDKVLKRLAQNREAARKSRLRKKAYIQQLESKRIKLAQIEQELERARQQGLYIGGYSGDSTLGLAGIVNSGITTAFSLHKGKRRYLGHHTKLPLVYEKFYGVAAFEMEYGHWVEDQNKHVSELRTALQARVSDIELRMLVESGMRHYNNLFSIKAIAAKSDVFYVMSGMWKSSAERFFLWIGGFRPSGLLKILTPQLEPLTDRQVMAVCSLQQSSQQAEDALSQGLDRLQQTLGETMASDPLDVSSGVADYMGQMTQAMGKLDALESFVNQADHLRQQALQQMYRILTTRQAAHALLVLGDYLQRLRALSSLWAARPHEPP